MGVAAQDGNDIADRTTVAAAINILMDLLSFINRLTVLLISLVLLTTLSQFKINH